MHIFIICSYLDVQNVMEVFRVHTYFYSGKKKIVDTELESFAKNSANSSQHFIREHRWICQG